MQRTTGRRRSGRYRAAYAFTNPGGRAARSSARPRDVDCSLRRAGIDLVERRAARYLQPRNVAELSIAIEGATKIYRLGCRLPQLVQGNRLFYATPLPLDRKNAGSDFGVLRGSLQ